MAEANAWSAGDWIVHTHYGVGQIKGVEKKHISGEEARYYKIKTAESTFWIPTDHLDGDMFRSISAPDEIQQAIEILQNPPRDMSSDHKKRQSRINRVLTRNEPEAVARLLRDLRARQREGSALNKTERSAFKSLRKRLVDEWSVVTRTKAEQVESKLEKLLNPDSGADNGGPEPDASQAAATLASSLEVQRKTWAKLPGRRNTKISG